MWRCATGLLSLMTLFFDLRAAGEWGEGREQNLLDGGAHFYGVFECACGNFVSIGSIEPQFLFAPTPARGVGRS